MSEVIQICSLGFWDTLHALLFVFGVVTPVIVFWLVALWFYASRRYHVEYEAKEMHIVTTADGWKLSVYRRQPKVLRYKEPVILCHGLGANRLNLDWPGASLASLLCRLGFDVWIAELRGMGTSERPRLFSRKRWSWTSREQVDYDLPAIIETVKEKTGAPNVLWVGHSMGGMLMYVYLAKGGPSVSAAFALASPSTFKPQWRMKFILQCEPVLKLLPFLPQRVFMGILSVFLGIVPRSQLAALANPDNLSMEQSRQLMNNLIEDISIPMAIEAARWMRDGEFVNADGSVNHYRNMDKITVPMGFAAGTKDLLATEHSVYNAYKRCGALDKTYRLFSKANGDSVDYGHGDIAISAAAVKEVHPHIAEFLIERATKVQTRVVKKKV